MTYHLNGEIMNNFSKKYLNIQYKLITSAFLCSFLPGCSVSDWFKKNEVVSELKNSKVEIELGENVLVPVQGEPLVTIEGVPVITVESLQAEKEKLLNADPKIKQMLPFMNPKEFDQHLLEGLTNQMIVDFYIARNKIAEKADYKAELNDGLKAIERMINTKYFSQAFNVVVSDAEARDFYDKNKELIPDFTISQGGARAMAVLFTSEAEAKAFAEKVRLGKNDIKAVVAQEGLPEDRLKDLKLVHARSVGIENQLRDAIVGVKKVPSVEVVTTGDNAFWVVAVLSKEEPKYTPFEQVKSEIMKHLEKQKRSEAFEKEIDRLKKEYKIVVNDNYYALDKADLEDSSEDK